MSRFKAICLVLFILLFVGACGGRRDIAEERAYRAARADGEIIIGVVERREGPTWKAIQMAVEEINAAGGVLGRKIQVIQQDDEYSVTKGKLVAQQFAANLDMVAVIGHGNSDVSIPASATYEFSGLLMLSPTATAPKLTQQGFKLVFRNIPSDEKVGSQMADFAARQGYKRMMILSAKDAYGRGLGNIFEKWAGEVGITVVDRVSYRDGESNFQQVLTNWKDLDFDAIFIAGRNPEAAHFIAQAREQGLTQPILGGDGLMDGNLLRIAGEAAEGTVVATYFHPDDPRPEVQQFNAAFQEKYGTLPDFGAAQGYDAVKLLAYAMEQAGSTVPVEVAETLRAMERWPGVTGPHTFSQSGDVIGKPIALNIVQDSQFEYFLTLENP